MSFNWGVTDADMSGTLTNREVQIQRLAVPA